ESVATFLDLKKDPETGANSAEVLRPTLADADSVAARLLKLPVVWRAITVSSLVPGEQEAKLAEIRKAAGVLDASLNPKTTEPKPNDEETITALASAAENLTQIAGEERG